MTDGGWGILGWEKLKAGGGFRWEQRSAGMVATDSVKYMNSGCR